MTSDSSHPAPQRGNASSVPARQGHSEDSQAGPGGLLSIWEIRTEWGGQKDAVRELCPVGKLDLKVGLLGNMSGLLSIPLSVRV